MLIRTAPLDVVVLLLLAFVENQLISLVGGREVAVLLLFVRQAWFPKSGVSQASKAAHSVACSQQHDVEQPSEQVVG